MWPALHVSESQTATSNTNAVFIITRQNPSPAASPGAQELGSKSRINHFRHARFGCVCGEFLRGWAHGSRRRGQMRRGEGRATVWGAHRGLCGQVPWRAGDPVLRPEPCFQRLTACHRPARRRGQESVAPGPARCSQKSRLGLVGRGSPHMYTKNFSQGLIRASSSTDRAGGKDGPGRSVGLDAYFGRNKTSLFNDSSQTRHSVSPRASCWVAVGESTTGLDHVHPKRLRIYQRR